MGRISLQFSAITSYQLHTLTWSTVRWSFPLWPQDTGLIHFQTTVATATGFVHVREHTPNFYDPGRKPLLHFNCGKVPLAISENNTPRRTTKVGLLEESLQQPVKKASSVLSSKNNFKQWQGSILLGEYGYTSHYFLKPSNTEGLKTHRHTHEHNRAIALTRYHQPPTSEVWVWYPTVPS